MKYTFDPDADVLAFELSKQPFDYAQEVGDFVVHFTKDGKPVYVEILHARSFIAKTVKTLPKPDRQTIVQQIQTI